MKHTPSRIPYLHLALLAAWLVAGTAAIRWTDLAPDTPYLAFARLIFTTVLASVNLFRLSWLVAILIGLGAYNAVMFVMRVPGPDNWIPLAVGNIVILVAALLAWLTARQIAALQNQVERANNMIQDLRVKDPALGVVRLPYAMQTLRTEVLRSQRYQSHLCLILAKIADEEEIQNEQGSTGLFEIKRQVSEVLNGMLREMDLLFSSNYFGIILPETSTEGAMVVARRITDSIARKVRVGMYIGVAEFGVDAFSDEELYSAAETALQLAQKMDKAVVNYAQVRYVTDEPEPAAAE